MVAGSDGGKGDTNDTGRPSEPLGSCSRHPSVVTSGACPACLREAARRPPPPEAPPPPPEKQPRPEHSPIV